MFMPAAQWPGKLQMKKLRPRRSVMRSLPEVCVRAPAPGVHD
jgi:hypothetical protein